MRRAATAALLILLAVSASAKNPRMDEAMSSIEKAQSAAEAMPGMTYILEHASEAPAVHLFMASMAALGNKRAEDAAFLLYAAQFRAQFDLARFPPKQSGGNSPAILLGALNQQIGEAVNPEIMRAPKSFAAVVKRVEAWSPATPGGYEPGWEYSSVADARAKQELATSRAAFIRQFDGMSTLLNDPQYFAAFTIVQDFNFSTFEQMQDPKRIKAREAAEAKMLEIEKKRDIEGLYYKRK
jgi:hypothetical protein